MSLKEIKRYFVLLFCLSTIYFFSPVQISESLLYYTYYFLFLIVIINILFFFNSSYRNPFILPILLFLIAELISIYSAVFFWGQSFLDSLKGLSPFFSYILFLLLLIWNFKARDVEIILIILACCFIAVYAISFLTYPLQIFGEPDKYGTERGFIRISVAGSGYLFLFSFYSLNQYFIKRKISWLFIYTITLTCIIMTLSRMLISVSLILSLIYLLRKSSLIKRIIAILIFSFCLYLVSEISFVKILIDTTKNQNEQKEDDIRIQSANFYLNNIPSNSFSKFFGNGQPYKGSQYSESVKNYEEDGFYTSDIGWIGLYSKFGLLAILAYIIIIYKSLKFSVSEKYMYSKYFLYFVFIISIIIDAPFSNNFIPAIVFALYLVSTQNNTNIGNNSVNKLRYLSNNGQISNSNSRI